MRSTFNERGHPDIDFKPMIKLQYSSSGRPIHASLRSAGNGESEARLRLAFRTPSVATSCRNLPLDCRDAAISAPRTTFLAATPTSREATSLSDHICAAVRPLA